MLCYGHDAVFCLTKTREATDVSLEGQVILSVNAVKGNGQWTKLPAIGGFSLELLWDRSPYGSPLDCKE